jgi:CubicO group peptidase (beta-lactamase class C family)
MGSFEENAQKLSKSGPGQLLPAVAAIAADDTGMTQSSWGLNVPIYSNSSTLLGAIRYSETFGETSKGPITVDSTMWIASCTKLLATIAVLQCVEKGLLTLDDPVGTVLPELADPDLLYGFDEETKKPLIRKAKNKITMRQLLTHSSGLAYEWMHPALAKMNETMGKERTTQVDGKVVRHSPRLSPVSRQSKI